MGRKQALEVLLALRRSSLPCAAQASSLLIDAACHRHLTAPRGVISFDGGDMASPQAGFQTKASQFNYHQRCGLSSQTGSEEPSCSGRSSDIPGAYAHLNRSGRHVLSQGLHALHAQTPAAMPAVHPAKSAWSLTSASQKQQMQSSFHSRSCATATAAAEVQLDQPDRGSSTSSGTGTVRQARLANEIRAIMSFHALNTKLTPELLQGFGERLLMHTLDHAYNAHRRLFRPHATPGGKQQAVPDTAELRQEREEYEAVMTKLVEVYVRLLAAASQAPAGAAQGSVLAPEAAVAAVHTFAEMAFNVGGTMDGLKSLSQHYRLHILPLLLQQHPDGTAKPKSPMVLVDMLWAFAKLFTAADRAEKEAVRAQAEEQIAANSNTPHSSLAAGAQPSVQPADLWDGSGVIGDSQLVYALADYLSASQLTMHKLSMRYLAKCAQALCLVNCAQYGFLQLIVDVASKRLKDINHASLAVLLDSLSRLNFESLVLCDEVARNLLPKVYHMQTQDLVRITQAFARLRYENPDWMQQVSQQLQLRLAGVDFAQAAQIAWSFSVRGVRDERLFDGLAARLAASMKTAKPRDISAALTAFAKAGHSSPALLQAAERHMAGSINTFYPPQLSQAMRAFTALNYYSPPLFKLASSRARVLLAASPLLPHDGAYQFSHQNIADLAWAYGLALKPATSKASQSGLALQHPDAPLFKALADRALSLKEVLGKTSMVDLATAFSEGGLQDRRVLQMLQEASLSQLSDMGPVYLGRIMRAFALVAREVPVSSHFWTSCLDVSHMKWSAAQNISGAAQNIRWAALSHPASQEVPDHPLWVMLGVSPSR